MPSSVDLNAMDVGQEEGWIHTKRLFSDVGQVLLSYFAMTVSNVCDQFISMAS
jgi:hypothetical protein